MVRQPIDQSDVINVAILFKEPLFTGAPPTADKLKYSAPGHGDLPKGLRLAVEALSNLGLEPVAVGRQTMSIRATVSQLAKVFDREKLRLEIEAVASAGAVDGIELKREFLDRGLPPAELVSPYIDEITVQFAPMILGQPAVATPAGSTQISWQGVSEIPPAVGKYCLNVMTEVPKILEADTVPPPPQGATRIKVAMIDTGFAHGHPFFVENQFTSTRHLAPGASGKDLDRSGHGTGISANLFAIAGKVVDFIGVKLDADDPPSTMGASLLGGFQTALPLGPSIISLSVAYNYRKVLPKWLRALETEIRLAAQSGTIVVAAAGDGQYAFPAHMKEVIAVGGVFRGEPASSGAFGDLQVSDFASAFVSEIYPGRLVPDVCGLCGMAACTSYIMMPVPPESAMDRKYASFQGPAAGFASDGWAAFSGTSASTPQVAGVCALLLAAVPGLTTQQIKDIFNQSSRDVADGTASPECDPAGVGLAAGVGVDLATGAGLVQAMSSWLAAQEG